jgi:hypothetical protein
MPSTALFAGNTGRVHVGRGFQPSTDLASPIIGDIVVNGGEISEARQFKEEKIWQGDLWLTGSIAGQTVIVEEELELQGAYG